MKSQAFKSKAEQTHRLWLGDVLGISTDGAESAGIDLFDDKIGIELKSKLDRYSINFAVHDYQVSQFEDQHHTKELFWAFLTYSMTKKVSQIRSVQDIRDSIDNREVRILPWDWVRQFPIWRPKTGPYRYVSKNAFPEDSYFSVHPVQNGKLYVPKGSTLEHYAKNAQQVRSA